MSVHVIKSILTTAALLVALVQATSGVLLWGRFQSLPVPARAIRLWHRVGGDVTLGLAVAVAFICVWHLFVIFHATLFPLHAALGTVAVVTMVAKVIIGRRRRRLLRYNLALGVVAGLFVLGDFATSVLPVIIVRYFT